MKMKIKSFLACLLLVALPAYANRPFTAITCNVESSGDNSSVHRDASDAIQIVSIFQLISNPEKYNGQRVSVVGILDYHLDGSWIFPTEETFKAYDLSSSFSADLPPRCSTEAQVESLAEISGKYVRLIGRFNSKHRLGAGFDQGQLEKIELIALYNDN